MQRDLDEQPAGPTEMYVHVHSNPWFGKAVLLVLLAFGLLVGYWEFKEWQVRHQVQSLTAEYSNAAAIAAAGNGDVAQVLLEMKMAKERANAY